MNTKPNILNKKSIFILAFFFVLFWVTPMFSQSEQGDRPNILMVVIDDMNDWTNYLGNEQVITPNLDKLAAKSTKFNNAYSASPICNPSRTAFITGLLPIKTEVYGNNRKWADAEIIDNIVTLPEHLKNNDYETIWAGKLYHGNKNNGYRSTPEKLASTWDDMTHLDGGYGPGVKNSTKPSGISENVANFDVGVHEGEESDFADVTNTDKIISFLEQAHDKPFMATMGYYRPHNPWTAPQRFFDKYPLDEIQLPDAIANDTDDISPYALNVMIPEDNNDRIVETGWSKTLVQGYLASVTFMDENFGRLIDALENSEYADNTIIVVFGDHGFSHGQKGLWDKNALWRQASRTPLLIHNPMDLTWKGEVITPVSLLDIYPTIADLCGTTLPTHLDGHSLKPLLLNHSENWEYPAITYRGSSENVSVRLRNWSYLQYADGSQELYNLETDELEWYNLAYNSDYSAIIDEMVAEIPVKQKVENNFIEHKSSGQKLHNNETDKGAEVDLDNSNIIGENAEWELIPIADDSDYYRIEHMGSQRWLHCLTSALKNITLVAKSDTSDNTKWKIINVDNTYSRVEHKASGQWLYSSKGSGLALKLTVTTAVGDNTQWKVPTASGSLSISENNSTKSFKAWPNPTDSILNLSGISSGDHIDVFDLLGKKLYSKKASSDSLKLNTAIWNRGMYILKVTSVDKSESLKIVLK
ncbi:sulfatase-like hydrolase/transferase [Algibacter amylolyticus]|uniref:Sulfatase-like hydrolase/transferase n=1 Tax=Algibacter amylolyticus TaxID=1608400 RepID=A0A5M7BA89_9FLAO|nr:sulfatase-like hydrolase/transferase [Algibacter amylolyticus]KAA5825157.1 sulfatase-like hydrolase/transferase [Algibacter amylolyticus]MBB5268734.1 arylsulfatase A-like enzyme [Algibacter amylolyticus]TSJ77651.1 sulfatase-like hydrolase/transferase [Algibacter amylolyticus]